MKVHHINILLFALSLNILEHNQRNHNNTTLHTPITRSLCECELYKPANYDNDAEMKRVMQQFEDRTSQRFHEYDDRMVEKRKQCKDRCNKEIQKIILKDKLEKELMDKFATLQTDIQSDAIPTCVCEKSIADKMEKGCLRCGGVLGGGIAPTVGLLGGIGQVALNAWKPTAIATAIEAALKLNADKISAAANAAGIEAGKKLVIDVLKHFGVDTLCPKAFKSISNINHYREVAHFVNDTYSEYWSTCRSFIPGFKAPQTCQPFELKLHISTPSGSTYGTPPQEAIRKLLQGAAEKANTNAVHASAAKSAKLTAQLTEKQTTLIEGGFNSTITSINAAIIAIVIIVLIMVIIYLILRYRRKKKMKKKLQYIKLLEE
ncbi:rifin [Plasmodium reichenowi]|uniref:Rifin n=1 Tax=Plasmodium reichenowi TaxID=5854 RepID=A0A060RME8_PLARE|nr:rifin [Plasmodium reichenowi]